MIFLSLLFQFLTKIHFSNGNADIDEGPDSPAEKSVEEEPKEEVVEEPISEPEKELEIKTPEPEPVPEAPGMLCLSQIDKFYLKFLVINPIVAVSFVLNLNIQVLFPGPVLHICCQVYFLLDKVLALLLTLPLDLFH